MELLEESFESSKSSPFHRSGEREKVLLSKSSRRLTDQIQRKVQKVLWCKSSRWLAECSEQFRKFLMKIFPMIGWIKCSELRPLVSANKLTFLNPLYTYTKKSVLRVVAADYHSLRWLTPSASKISQTNFKTSFWGVEIDTRNQTRNQLNAHQLGKNSVPFINFPKSGASISQFFLPLLISAIYFSHLTTTYFACDSSVNSFL